MMFMIQTNQTSETHNTVMIKQLFSGMAALNPTLISDSSTFSEEEKNGQNADGIPMMKIFQDSGEYLM